MVVSPHRLMRVRTIIVVAVIRKPRLALVENDLLPQTVCDHAALRPPAAAPVREFNDQVGTLIGHALLGHLHHQNR